MSGYCSLHATDVPSFSVARWTWPREAAAAASRPNSRKWDSQAGPSSVPMRRRTKAQPMGGALACREASCWAYSSGSALGTVERNCATFISGPFRPPRMDFRSSACAALSVLMPRKRSPATRAAMPPTAPEVRAMRRISPKRVFSRSAIRPGPQSASPQFASSSSMKPAITSRPRFQKRGSEASRPKGASSSLWRSVPPARSRSRYFSAKSGTAPSW